MENTNTHILCEPYEADNYIEKNTIRNENFIEKTSELIESIKNSNYEYIDEIKNLDKDIIKNYMSLKIPYDFTDFSKDIIYQYSNSIELNKLILSLREYTKDIYNLDSDESYEDIIDILNIFKNKLIDFKNGNVYNKSFDTFESLSSFENVISISDSLMYNSLIEWISEFPKDLLNLEFDRLTDNIGENNPTNSEDDENEKLIELKKEILFNIFELYKIIIKNIINTKIFWNSFLDLIEPDNKINEFINTDVDEKINSILNELDEMDDIDYDEDEYIYGNEDGDFAKSNKKPLEVSAKFFKEFPGKINKIRKQFKMYRMRAKNNAFYMKYMGRIEGLFERYADEASVLENGMKGDPVQTLKEEAHEYISGVSNEFVDIQNSLIDLSKKFASSGDPKQMFAMLKSFGGLYMGDVQKSASIPESFLTSMRFKIGELITKHNKIYGYTAQSIAENKKLPPSNHAIVSLFVDRPDEKPFEQKVSDVIKDVDSFKLIAKNEKEPIFEVSVICSDILTKGIQRESYNQLKINKKESKEKLELKLRDLKENSKDYKKERRDMIRQFKGCWTAMERAYDYCVKTKSYVSDLIQSYFVMMTRIDNLCKVCLTSLLHVETMHRDGTYNTGHKADKLKSHKEYSQDEKDLENRKTVGEKEIEKKEKYSERKQEIMEHREKIMNVMRHMK